MSSTSATDFERQWTAKCPCTSLVGHWWHGWGPLPHLIHDLEDDGLAGGGLNE